MTWSCHDRPAARLGAGGLGGANARSAARQLAAGPLPGSSRESWHRVGTRGTGGRLLRWLRDGSLRHAAANVVLGRRMRERVIALGVDPSKIVQIPNWADGTELRPMDRDANPLRAEWRIGGEFVVGYSGNMGRAHEFQTVLEAQPKVAGANGIVFLFVGGGAQKAEVEGASGERSRTGAADVHLVTLRPSSKGSSSQQVLRHRAVGRPTIFIGDPEGEIGSVVREVDCGICVEQGDVAGLVEAITVLRDDPQLRERMGSNARRVFEERYDKLIAVEQWRRLLDGTESCAQGEPVPQ